MSANIVDDAWKIFPDEGYANPGLVSGLSPAIPSSIRGWKPLPPIVETAVALDSVTLLKLKSGKEISVLGREVEPNAGLADQLFNGPSGIVLSLLGNPFDGLSQVFAFGHYGHDRLP